MERFCAPPHGGRILGDSSLPPWECVGRVHKNRARCSPPHTRVRVDYARTRTHERDLCPQALWCSMWVRV